MLEVSFQLWEFCRDGCIVLQGWASFGSDFVLRFGQDSANAPTFNHTPTIRADFRSFNLPLQARPLSSFRSSARTSTRRSATAVVDRGMRAGDVQMNRTQRRNGRSGSKP